MVSVDLQTSTTIFYAIAKNSFDRLRRGIPKYVKKNPGHTLTDGRYRAWTGADPTPVHVRTASKTSWMNSGQHCDVSIVDYFSDRRRMENSSNRSPKDIYLLPPNNTQNPYFTYRHENQKLWDRNQNGIDEKISRRERKKTIEIRIVRRLAVRILRL